MELYTEKEVYRPFWEKDSALLETELGCSWHKCAFCDFTKDDFYIFPLEEIEKSKNARTICKSKKTYFCWEKSICNGYGENIGNYWICRALYAMDS